MCATRFQRNTVCDVRAALADSEHVAQWLEAQKAEARAAALEEATNAVLNAEGIGGALRALRALTATAPTEPTCATCGGVGEHWANRVDDWVECRDCAGTGRKT